MAFQAVQSNLSNGRWQTCWLSFLPIIQWPVPSCLCGSCQKLGYIWGVFVEPKHRKKGLARQLTHQAVIYLQSLGCTRIVLHASASGTSIYKSLGFVNNNKMKLDLVITKLYNFPSPVQHKIKLCLGQTFEPS
ncbi:hypothetical protein WJX77_004024 [Trebouxia sp. C0004]